MIRLDGALGTELSRRGHDTSGPLWSARVLLEAPEAIVEVHRDALRAGAQVLTACTFRTQARTLGRAGLSGRADALNRRAVECAREALRAEGVTEGRVAGSIAPLEDCFRPEEVPPDDELAAEHAAHARSLAAAGADLLIAETMGTVREAQAAVAGARAQGLPTWCSFTTSAPGVLLSGEPLADGVRAAQGAGASAVLVNCVPAAEAAGEIAALRSLAGATPCGIAPGVGHPRGGTGPWSRALMLSPEEFAAHLRDCRDLGASILGGCCGTEPAHLAAAWRLIDQRDCRSAS